ncbi:MAG: serine/threonine-protein phosphatase [Candidatus Accumulibacter sp.]|nr:serine/threonine-protein phosphatase [Accumulibacter sp.]
MNLAKALEIASATHTGMVRSHNEDAISSDGEVGLAVLADGMGGYNAGEVASGMATAFIKSELGRWLAEASETATDTDVRRAMDICVDNANRAIFNAANSNPQYAGMGTTLVAAVFTNEGVEWVSVGDSPLLLFRRGEIALLNEDHSLAPELDRLAALGRITPEQAKTDPRRHMLRSAVTGDELDLVDVSRRPLVLEDGDYIILASDGVQTLEMTEIQRIVSAYADDGAESVANALIRAVEAIRDPHQDNTTILAVRPLPVPA